MSDTTLYVSPVLSPYQLDRILVLVTAVKLNPEMKFTAEDQQLLEQLNSMSKQVDGALDVIDQAAHES